MADRTANSRVLLRACAAALLAGAVAAPALGQAITASSAPFPPTPYYPGGQQTITLNLNDSIQINQIQIGAAGANYPDYSVSPITCQLYVTLPAASTCTVGLSFNPYKPGWGSSPAPISHWAPLEVSYYDTTTNTYGTFVLALTGTGQGTQAVLNQGRLSDLIGNDVTHPSGFGGDGDVAANAIFKTPAGIAMDVLGNIYIADSGNGVVRLYYQGGSFPQISSTPVVGDVYTIAGIAPTGGVSAAGPGTDGVLATASALNNPAGLALDALGNLYISDSNNQAIRMVTATTGIITTVAGTLNNPESPGTGFGGDLGPATQAFLYTPSQITVDGYGNLFIADAGNNAIRVVYAGGAALATLIATEIPGTTAVVGDIYTIAGGPANAALPSNGDGGLASLANLNFPQGVTVDSQGDVFIADSSNHEMRRVDAVTGNIAPIYTGTDTPVSLSLDSSDSIYFTLQHSCTVMQYNPTVQANPSAPVVTAVAGNGSCTASGDAGLATAGGLSGASGVVVDQSGNLYLLESDGVRMDSVSAIQPLIINFGNVNVGTTATNTIFITDDDILPYNSGSYDFSLPDYFQFSPPYGTPFGTTAYAGATTSMIDCNAAELSPGGTCGSTFTFTPIADGGPFSVYAFSEAQINVQLFGMGTGPLPTASLTGGPFNFVAIVNETVSPSQPLILKNTSAINLTLESLYFDSANFRESDTCGFSSYLPSLTLAPGAQCEIDISFATNTPGALAGNVYVVDNASTGGGSQSVPLNATGIAPVGTLSVSTLRLPITVPGSVSNGNVTLTNTGTATLNINPTGFSISGDQPAEFAITGNTCGATLAINATCQLSVSFTPATFAYYSATLNIQDDTGGVRIYHVPTIAYQYNTQSVTLIGPTGNPPVGANLTIGNATFPSTAVGVPETQNVTLTLARAAAIKFVSISPGFTEYAIGAITGCTIDGATVNAAGTVCSIPVTFTPAAPGIRNAPLLATDIENTVATPYSFGLSGTGLGPVAALTPGIITTVVGGGHGAANGFGFFDDGPATAAQIGFQSGMAIDSAGQFFIADSESEVIWKTDTAGNIHMYAGSPFTYGGYLEGLGGDGGTAIGAQLGYVGVIALDAKDGLYIAESDCCGDPIRIRYVDPGSGLITTAVGFVPPGSWASSSGFAFSTRIVVNVSGTKYLFFAGQGGTSGSSQPTWPTSTGATVFDGSITWQNQGVYFGGAGCSTQTDIYGDGCLASQVLLGDVTGMVVDPTGNLFFSDTDGMIRRVDATSKMVSSVAGTPGSAGYKGDGGAATAAEVNPGDIAIDSNGNLIFIDAAGYVVRKVTVSTGMISTLAGTPKYTAQQDYCFGGGNYGGPAVNALFAFATSVAVDAANNIYISDNSGCVLSRIDAGTNTIHVIAGIPQSQAFYENFGYGDLGFSAFSSDGDASYATLNQPQVLRLDGTANVYIASGYGGVRKIDTSQSVLNFTGGTSTVTPPGYSTNGQQLDTVSGPQTATVLNAGNSGAVSFTNPFTSLPNWGITNQNYIRDVTSPTGTQDCYTLGNLPIGYTCPISVDFAPLSGSGYTLGTDTVNDNAVPGAGSQPIHLIGYVYGTYPLVTLSPPLLSFSTPQGATSSPQYLILTNNDVNPLPISSITLTGPGASSFSLVSACGTSLAASSSCKIQVFFNPAVTSGGYVSAPPPDILTATVSVNDTAASTPQQSQLIGTGTLPAYSGKSTVLTVTATSFSRAFGTPNPVLTYTITGFVNGDTAAVLSGTPLISTSATLNSPAGIYAITASAGTLAAPSNYTLSYAAGMLTVNGTMAQTITFSPIPNLPHTISHITLTAHSSSGLPIAYTINGPATLTGTTLTFTGTGSITVTANQPGNATFNPAPSVARTFTVLP